MKLPNFTAETTVDVTKTSHRDHSDRHSRAGEQGTVVPALRITCPGNNV